jgi:SAM-dependent methyltransferase
MKSDNFIDIPFITFNLDRYIVRRSILEALTKVLSLLDGKLLDAGCGKMPYKNYVLSNSTVNQYVGLDIEVAIKYDKNIRPDYTWDGKVMPFDESSFDCCVATEVLEHCPDPEMFLNETYRVLRSGGVFFFTVPFLWPLHEVPYDEYRYTPFSLERHLKNAGFKDIKIEAMGGWHASMAQMLGLWVRRASLSKGKKFLLSILIKPIYKYLLKMDKPPVKFEESTMITGLWGVAKK